MLVSDLTDGRLMNAAAAAAETTFVDGALQGMR